MNSEKRVERGLLNLLSEKSRKELLDVGKVITLRKGEILFAEREEVKCMYIILDGFVALYRNSRYGEIKIIFICTNGEVLNEVVLQDKKTSICTKALADTQLLCVHRSELYKLMADNTELSREIFDSLARKTRRLYHQVGNANGTYPIEKRLAAKIWKLARDYGNFTPEGVQISFELTVTFLASMLGAKRETVSRIISSWKKDEIVIHENGFLTVIDMKSLKEISQ
ncbi:Crp/Fnr family transcriptional regulator [Pseudobutyrivibrio sp.]|uniref:Crp/Fnr family transcriptional regulator n=1 Tax=Pseudobutyrivibrio sp. TaxID=2014367 RepID=UPI001B5DEB6C|nr:Crp/Fnr family transcriptional regulator [Pseudobutyrivibrio sp.]MBP3261564.1 Crp/Fnr family transcriptional regulator [Pseudobutyrivibrio sp.]